MLNALQKRTNNRFRFSLATLLLVLPAVAIAAVWTRPYFLPPPQWREFSLIELRAEQELGNTVIVYFRDDWWLGFDKLQSELQSKKLGRAIHQYDVVLIVANETLNNPAAETELIRISGSNNIPEVAIYSSDQSPLLLNQPITPSQLIDALHGLRRKSRKKSGKDTVARGPPQTTPHEADPGIGARCGYITQLTSGKLQGPLKQRITI